MYYQRQLEGVLKKVAKEYSAITLYGARQSGMGSNTARNQTIDILKGFGMVLVVFNHIGWGIYVHTYIQSFHMPLFFLVSGYLWKDRQFKDVMLRRFRTLVVPYLFFCSIYTILELVLNLTNKDKYNLLIALKTIILFPTDMPHMPVGPAVWFLPVLFFASLLFSLLNKTSVAAKSIVILLMSIAAFVYSDYSASYLPFAINVVAVSILFMSLGQFGRAFEKVIFSSKTYLYVFLLAVGAGLSLINGPCDLRTAQFHFVPLYLLVAIVSVVGWSVVIKRIQQSENKAINVLKREMGTIGRRSIVYLCTHQLFIEVVYKVVPIELIEDNPINRVIFRIVLFVLVMMMCWLISFTSENTKIGKFVFGK